MSITLIVVRHGNTFLPGEIPLRIGARTDLPLVESAKSQNIGRWLLREKLIPSAVFVSPLIRTLQTAIHIQQALGRRSFQLRVAAFLREIDYGPDEGQPETQVMQRLGLLHAAQHISLSAAEIALMGRSVMERWEKFAEVPPGWNFNAEQCILHWQKFASFISKHFESKVILVVTSNGIARFAPYLTGDFDAFARHYPLKLSTGGIGILKQQSANGQWECAAWNIQPD